MSVENLAENTAAEPTAPVMSDDEQLGALFDQISRDNGAARGDDGKFTSPNGGNDPAPAEEAQEDSEGDEKPALEGEGKGEGDDGAVSTPEVVDVPLPANWRGSDGKVRPDLEAIWTKLAPEDRQTLSRQQGELHSRMSDQGRQIGTFRPVQEVLEQNKDLWEGGTMADGTPADARAAVDFLFGAQRKIQADPARSLIEIADNLGARDALVSELVAQSKQPQRQQQNSQTPRQPAGPTLAQIEESMKTMMNDRFREEASRKEVEDEVSRLAADKPLYADIPESKMIAFIHMAREDLGEAASNEAVFNRAYDMAVHSDSTLRAKAAAATEAEKQKKAAVTDPKKTADAKRAASVNVTSTKAGAPRKLSEDDELSSLYDELKAS